DAGETKVKAQVAHSKKFSCMKQASRGRFSARPPLGYGIAGLHLPIRPLRAPSPDARTLQMRDKTKTAAATLTGPTDARRARWRRSHARRTARVALVSRNLRGFRART